MTSSRAAGALYLLYSAVAFQLVRTRPRPWFRLTTQLIGVFGFTTLVLGPLSRSHQLKRDAHGRPSERSGRVLLEGNLKLP